MPLPLHGIKVLDFTRILAGPFCTMKLGDMGAEVIKIEQPEKGDDTRSWGPPFINGESAYFLSINRNKKSVTLDLKANEAKEILHKLIMQSDVVVENFRAGIMQKLGLGYDDVRKINPKIIYCSISGYGQTSSRSKEASFDLVVQGESGLMDITGFSDGAPTKAGISLADVTAGNLAFEGILLALFHRERTGEGQLVDISLLDGLLSLFTYQSQIALSSSKKPTRKGNIHPTITPYETYKTKNGFINVAIGTEQHWKNFCEAVKRTDLQRDACFVTNAKRVENRALLETELKPIFLTHTNEEWISFLQKADVPVGKINSLNDALQMKILQEREMLVSVQHKKAGDITMVGNPIKLSSTQQQKFTPPPLVGEHTEEVLLAIGLTKEEFKVLSMKKVV
jgi:crotonobetainyl-CoA:carnitine CoA-transferase CaiB-like acyl-CoA transferase